MNLEQWNKRKKTLPQVICNNIESKWRVFELHMLKAKYEWTIVKTPILKITILGFSDNLPLLPVVCVGLFQNGTNNTLP